MARDYTAAGRRNTRVTVQSKAVTTAPDGQKVHGSWTTYCTRWAHTEPVAGGERQFRGVQVQPETRWVIELPSDTETRAITAQMQVAWNGKTAGIVRVYDPAQQRQLIWLECREVETQ